MAAADTQPGKVAAFGTLSKALGGFGSALLFPGIVAFFQWVYVLSHKSLTMASKNFSLDL